jgi:hypothetical protein
MSQQHILQSPNHYIRFSISPPCEDALTLRKSIQDGLTQTFGITSSNTYMDILWIAEDGSETVIRVRKELRGSERGLRLMVD